MVYFIIADLHGDYNAMIKGLERAHYEPQNTNHQIISLGDHFGRAGTGLNSKGVWKYLTNRMAEYQHVNAPICIRGNHESILLDVFRRGYLTQTDIYNGEASTISSFAHCSKSQAICDGEYIRIASKSGVEEWIMGLPWFYETKNYIFVHGFLPFPKKDWGNWDKYCDEDWHEASWTNTLEEIQWFEKAYPNGWNKHIVVGHWTSAEFYSYFDRKYDNYGKVYTNPKLKFTCCDCTTAYSHNVDVFVIEDEPIGEEEHE